MTQEAVGPHRASPDAESGAEPNNPFKGLSANKLIVVTIFRVNWKMLTSKYWFSLGLISKILVWKGPGGL